MVSALHMESPLIFHFLVKFLVDVEGDCIDCSFILVPTLIQYNTSLKLIDDPRHEQIWPIKPNFAYVHYFRGSTKARFG